MDKCLQPYSQAAQAKFPGKTVGQVLNHFSQSYQNRSLLARGHAESWELSPLKDGQAALNKRGEWEKSIFQHQKHLLPSKRDTGDFEMLSCRQAEG